MRFSRRVDDPADAPGRLDLEFIGILRCVN
jgi:hypothetical protein